MLGSSGNLTRECFPFLNFNFGITISLIVVYKIEFSRQVPNTFIFLVGPFTVTFCNNRPITHFLHFLEPAITVVVIHIVVLLSLLPYFLFFW